MKGIVLASVALSLLLIANVSMARDVSIYPVLNQQQVNVGDEVSVKINIDQVSDAFQMIRYDREPNQKVMLVFPQDAEP